MTEKKVKSILNKMTKEKFDRLAEQMCEIPVFSYEILKLLIGNVYEKAIDEPSFGDMYGDLCAKLSHQVQTDSFVQVIESDEEPPTEDGEASPASPDGQSSTNSVFRWSHDVSTTDSEIVGPFGTVEECFDVALSDTEQERVERGEMELELAKLQIKGGMFVKVLKKTAAEAEEGEEVPAAEYYTVYFPVANHIECGQQLSKIFLSHRECMSDATKQNSFKRSLLNKCEDEFNKQDIYVDWKKEKAAYEENKSNLAESERAEKEEELNFRRIKIKKQMLGNIKFIGQLYKKGLLKEKIMRFCIADLLKLEAKDPGAKLPVYNDTGATDLDEEDHEAICNMFSTIGSTIDGPAAAGFMTVCFDKIKKMSIDQALPSRSRFMYKDLLELRGNKWIPRRKAEKAKTIEEIRKDFEREERLKQQQSQQMSGGYRGNRNDYGGRNDRRSGDFRTNNRGGNQAGNNPRRSTKVVAKTDDDGFTTIISGSAKTKQQAPQRQSQKVSTRQSFAALADEAPAAKKKQTPEPLSDEKLERRIKSIRGEFIQDPNNKEELMLSMDEISGTPEYGVKFVQQNSDRIIDCKEDERAAIYKLITTVYEAGKISSGDVKAGLADLVEFIDSYVCDAPKAFDYLGNVLSHMIKVNAVDIKWICEQAEKTKLSSGENPVKIMTALVVAMKSVLGDDKTKSLFGAGASAVEGLLGKEKLQEVQALL